MKKIVFLFPGQGSQYVGMGMDIARSFPVAAQVFEQASQVMGFDLKELCFQGPEDKLNQTVYTQPAVLTTSAAILAVLESHGISAQWAAGHSLGEYTALLAAKVFSLPEALNLVQRRAEYMSQAVLPGEGAMAAVVGLEREHVIDLCSRFTQPDMVEAANFNCPGQIVISGLKKTVEQAVSLCKEKGAKMCTVLPVSVPSHCSLMAPAASRLIQTLEKAKLAAPRFPVIANVNARSADDGKQIKELLVKQVYSPVLWEDSIRYLLGQGAELFIEVGPGKVLSRLLKRISNEAVVVNVEDTSSLQRALTFIAN